jgi:hypothetical protein
VIEFLHWASFAVWLGAAVTLLVWGQASRQASLETWAHTWRAVALVQRGVVAPAAAVATITGVVLSMRLVRTGEDVGGATWLYGMQGSGLVAAVLALAVVTPLSNRMAAVAARSLEKGQREPVAEGLRVKLDWFGWATVVVVLAALYFAASKPM